MHAVNNLMGGNYVTKDDCRLAANQVLEQLCLPRQSVQEERASHLNNSTGWLSLDVINVLGSANLGFHVQESPLSLDAALQVASSALGLMLNWNQQHWTVMKVDASSSAPETFTHFNSIAGAARHHGLARSLSKAEVLALLSSGQKQYGEVSIYAVVSNDSSDGTQALDTEGRLSFLPPEVHVEPSSNSCSVDTLSGLTIITCNVDCLGDYPDISPAERMRRILQRFQAALGGSESFHNSSVLLLLQEVNSEMYKVLINHLQAKGWQCYMCPKTVFPYFIVTVVAPALKRHVAGVKYASFPHSTQGRHYVSVTLANWCVTNVHIESGSSHVSPQIIRDRRERQFGIMANKHLRDPGLCHVLAGDFNMRSGEGGCFQAEGWSEAKSDDITWTWTSENYSALYDRCFYHAPEGVLLMHQQHATIPGVCGTGRVRLSDHKALLTVLTNQLIDSSDALNASCIATNAKPTAKKAAFPRPCHDKASSHRRHRPKQAMSLRKLSPLQISLALQKSDQQLSSAETHFVSQALSASTAGNTLAAVMCGDSWDQLHRTWVHSVVSLKGHSAQQDLQILTSKLQCCKDASDIFSLLSKLLPAVFLKSLNDFNWLFARPPLLNKNNNDDLDVNSIGDSLSLGLLITAVPLLLRAYLWQQVADMMPGKSDVWQEELARELSQQDAAQDSSELPFLSLAEVKQMFAIEAMRDQCSFWKCAQSFDLPKARGSQRTLSRTICLHGIQSGVSSHSLPCHTPFGRAWCKFLLRSCYEYVKAEWTKTSAQGAIVPKGHLLFEGSKLSLPVHEVYVMLQLVPDVCLKVAGSKEEQSDASADSCRCQRCYCFRRIREELREKTGENKTTHPSIHSNLWRGATVGFKYIWKHLLCWLGVLQQGHESWKFWDVSSDDILLLPEKDVNDIKRHLPLDYVKQHEGSSKWSYRQFVSEQKDQEKARQDLELQVNASRVGQATADELRVIIQHKRKALTERDVQSAQQPHDKITRHGALYKKGVTMEYAEGKLSINENHVTFQVHALYLPDAKPLLRLQQLPAWRKTFSVDRCNPSMPQAMQFAQNSLFSQVISHHASLEKAEKQKHQRQVRRAQGPTKVEDLSVVTRTAESIRSKKICYAWEGHRIAVTPRKQRPALPTNADFACRQQHAESTPKRALRKMNDKIRHNANKPSQLTAVRAENCDSTEIIDPMTKISRALDDETNLGYVRTSMEFLDSMRLHHCFNCDEEWPCFEANWPQAGAAFAGSRAGKSEVLEMHGFQKCLLKDNRCTRCYNQKNYRTMFCSANWQHLGPRHPALSSLTWYEGQLIARVHAVMSVLTLTATGQLCFAGHVCNYFQKTLEWCHGLPGKLRNKEFFVVKRRKSLKPFPVHKRQKKPITANRKRLMKAILEAIRFLPTVYAHSWIDEDHLKKVTPSSDLDEAEPPDAVEMSVDTSMDVFLRFETFEEWMRLASGHAVDFPCGSFIWQTALDAQVDDHKGGTSASTAWEFCCRTLLENATETDVLRTQHLSTLLCHWLETCEDDADIGGQNIETVYHRIFAGMREDAERRGKTIQTEQDRDEMRLRWLRLLIHGELDLINNRTTPDDGDCVVDLTIDCALHENEASMVQTNEQGVEVKLSAHQEAESIANDLLQQLQHEAEAESGHLHEEENLPSAADSTSDNCNIVKSLLRKCTWERIIKSKETLMQTRGELEQAKTSSEWGTCKSLQKKVNTLEKDMQLTLASLKQQRDKPGNEHSRESIKLCIFQLEDVLGNNDIWQERKRKIDTSELVQDLQQAEEQEHEDRASKIRDVLHFQAEFEEHFHNNRTVEGFNAMKRMQQARRALSNVKTMVDPPEFDSKIRDSDREPHWVPGIFPTIFQNETGDPFNYYLKEVNLTQWGPHVLMSKGWAAQMHATFLYWWMNTIQRQAANAAKKWYIADNPDVVGWTRDDLLRMDVKSLAHKMTGYTVKIPGTKASKSRLRRILLSMVRQLEVESTPPDAGANAVGEKFGDIPCVFGTLASQRYQWDQIIQVIARVELQREHRDCQTDCERLEFIRRHASKTHLFDGITDDAAKFAKYVSFTDAEMTEFVRGHVASLSKSKRRELVNRYPLFVAWYCAMRLELVLKTIVVPIFQAHAYAAVVEWSPTGGMVHVHYLLWKRSAPRFDRRAEQLLADAKHLHRQGVVGSAEIKCHTNDVMDYYSQYINEWNPAKDKDGKQMPGMKDDDEEHPAALDVQSLIALLQPHNAPDRLKFYRRAVQVEHLHSWHYPDPLGPPASSQPCAQLLRGTSNMWYCKNGYPRNPVCEVCEENISQDALRPDVWRVNFCRNDPLINPHVPLVTLGLQGSDDACPVVTCEQCQKYLCKYCSKHGKQVGRKNVLFEVVEDMKAQDERAWERFPDTFEATKLGSKLHKAFTAEVGEEMCQAELAHHANKSPEYFISRPVKDVYLYKNARPIHLRPQNKQRNHSKVHEAARAQQECQVGDDDDNWDCDYEESWGQHYTECAGENATKSITKMSDVDLYENRWKYDFPAGTLCSQQLPHVPGSCRLDWSACQCATACDQSYNEAGENQVPDNPYSQVLAASVFDFFRFVRFTKRKSGQFHWHTAGEYPVVLMSPTINLRLGPKFIFHARWCLMQYHPWDNRKHFLDMTDQDVQTYFEKWLYTPACPWYIVEDYINANPKSLRPDLLPPTRQKLIASKNSTTETPAEHDTEQEEDDDEEDIEEKCCDLAADAEDHRVLKALRDGYLQEISRNEEAQRRCTVEAAKHDYYRKTRCTSVAEEEQSATPWGVKNVCADSDDDDDFAGEQAEVLAENDALRGAADWINPPAYDTKWEAFAEDRHGKRVDLRRPCDPQGKLLSWTEVGKALERANAELEESSVNDEESTTYPLEKLDPTQRVFADRVLTWGRELVDCYKKCEGDGKPRDIPILKSWFCGSAGSGKSMTLKTIVHHLRSLFAEAGVPAKVQLTAYTGVAAFNIGFGAKTTCSGFQIFPNATFSTQLSHKAVKKLEKDWENVELLVVDEISFIGRALFYRMHLRLQQGRRGHFAQTASSAENHQFGSTSIILVGDFGQLEPIDDFSLCDLLPDYTKCPKAVQHLWGHAQHGCKLASLFKEAICLKRIHRSGTDAWWTRSCLLLRNLTKENIAEFTDNYAIWRNHDLDRGHFNEEQKKYFDNEAVWLCARCKDVGARNGTKLAHLAEDKKQVVHQIKAQHSSDKLLSKGSDAFNGLRSIINLSRGCKVIITRNVAYMLGLANGTRGKLVGIVYPEGSTMPTFPLAIIVDVPAYKGPVFYPGEPTWVPIMPMKDFQKNGKNSWRQQFPVVAGYAMTVNKSQGLTIEEGVVINLQGSAKFRPASKHGLPFVACTRSTSFALTAFKHIPPLEDFLQVLESDMLKKRRQFDEKLEQMHRDTLKKHSNMMTEEDEQRAHRAWIPPQNDSRTRAAMACPACSRH